MKTLAPLVQRPRVVRADLLRVVQRQPADSRQRGEDLSHRGELGSGEDALGDPAWRVQVFGKPPVIDRDGLHQHRAVRRQQPIARPEEFVVMLQPDRLEHLDADNLVERASQVAIVVAPQIDAAARLARVRNQPGGVGVLFRADRRRGDVAAVARRGKQREAAPPRADLQHAIARLQLEPLADAAQLVDLRRLERVVRVRIDRARVHQVRIEKQLEKGVAEIVVLPDIPAASRR